MKILKRNQLIILVISLMLITAGYLNFTANENNNSIQTTGPIAELGDAALVNSKPEKEKNENANTTENSNTSNNEKHQENDIVVVPDSTNTQETANKASNDQYFIKSKLERDTMYSQMLATYQEIYNNTNSTSEQKTEAMKEISKINNVKNSIMIAENLVVAKGFEDIVIFVNNNSTSVIIKGKELSPEQIAQVQNIISREISIPIEEIHISTK